MIERRAWIVSAWRAPRIENEPAWAFHLPRETGATLWPST
ncbi:hypothetical protein OH687_33500 [Burkholderia anthina]|nr:hypothetical protein OH687_33500 [Burkholderia anthina]